MVVNRREVPLRATDKIVEDDDPLSPLQPPPPESAADDAGAPSYQDRHPFPTSSPATSIADDDAPPDSTAAVV